MASLNFSGLGVDNLARGAFLLALYLIICSPKFSARVMAASFPLGNIKAWSKSKILNFCPIFRFAVVPGAREAVSLT